jgi:predicted short-subunit dehydrogenase-like oxidoreductase (DUF2520 family)
MELERDLPDSPGAPAGVAPMPSLALVGRGRVGGALERAARAAGVQVAAAGRDEAAGAVAAAEALLLCVPDDAIEEACEALSPLGARLRLVGHTSGATPLSALRAAAARGASTFSIHPLQTVPDAVADLTGAPCAVAGADAAAVRFAWELAERLGMAPFEVPEERRAAYHAAASMASNYLVALEESAVALLGEAGIEGGRELLSPLVLRTAANWAERGGEALTGPIARGDAATVERHRAALDELAPELLPLYDALAERTRELAGGS